MVLGSFSICWMPYVVVVCTQTASAYGAHDQILYKAVFSLAVANSGINPVIYAWKNTGFRRAFLRLLRFQTPDCPEFDRNFRATTNASTERKVPLETVVKKEPPPISPCRDGLEGSDLKDVKKSDSEEHRVNIGVVSNIVNNNCVKADRCRIIENMTYDGKLLNGAEKCHIIENLGFDDSLDVSNLRMIDSSGKESDNDSVVTLPMSQGDNKSAKISNGFKCNV